MAKENYSIDRDTIRMCYEFAYTIRKQMETLREKVRKYDYHSDEDALSRTQEGAEQIEWMLGKYIHPEHYNRPGSYLS